MDECSEFVYFCLLFIILLCFLSNSYKVSAFLRILQEFFINEKIDLKRYGANEGAWALITGASDGIGRQFANEFAKAGFNILLVSRTKSKLDEVAKDIETNNPNIKTKVVAIDFAKATEADYKELQSFCESENVTILVNNVGTNHSFPTPFAEEDPELLEAICTVNITTAVKLTRMVLPKMLSNINGLILNMGSFSGMIPTPLLSTYSASKAFLSTWTKCLTKELAGTGVHVQLFNTYFVTTKMSKIRNPSYLIPTAEDYVKAAMKSIGRSHHSSPYFPHALAEYVIGLCPEPIAININYMMNEDTRKRALKKKERLAKQE